MNIRFFQAGDEFAQLRIYNSAAAALPKFKPATILDIQRRVQAKDFDVASRLYAVDAGNVIGYCTFQNNGRIGYPWCLPGHESAAEELFAHTVQAMKKRNLRTAFAAYRKDWPTINDYFARNGFRLAREMVNYVLAFEDMPTPSARLSVTITPMVAEDVPAVYALDPTVFRAPNAAALKEALWHNPYFSPTSLFVMRGGDGAPQAAACFIIDNAYADPRAIDAAMPCFRLGAFGTEGLTTKRVRGLFSFVTRPDKHIFGIGMDLLGHAANRLTEADEVGCYAAQVASDAAALHAFYQRVFERQGSFPIYERNLAS